MVKDISDHKVSHLTTWGKGLWKAHQQKGGSWSDFTGWLKKAGNKIVDAGKTVYEKAIKPAYQVAKDLGLDKVAVSLASKALGGGKKKRPSKGGARVPAWSGVIKPVRTQPLEPPMKGAGKSVSFGH
jgi:hypothetical protein